MGFGGFGGACTQGWNQIIVHFIASTSRPNPKVQKLKISHIWLPAIAALMILGGCNPASSEKLPAFEMLELADLKVPPPMPKTVGLAAGFQDGGSATLILDNCPNEPIWQTDKGPIGSLVCGASYNVFYVPETKAWAAVGPNRTLQLQKATDTMTGAAYVGDPPNARKLIVWGLSITWRDDGQALLDGKVPIGRLIANAQARASTATPPTPANPAPTTHATPVQKAPPVAVDLPSSTNATSPSPARTSWDEDGVKKN